MLPDSSLDYVTSIYMQTACLAQKEKYLVALILLLGSAVVDYIAGADSIAIRNKIIPIIIQILLIMKQKM